MIQLAMIQACCMMLFWMWMPLAHINRVRSRPGSHQRYVWNTWEKIVRGPAACAIAAPGLILIPRDDTRMSGSSLAVLMVSTFVAAGVYVWCWTIARGIDRDDDDDWFKKKRRQFRRFTQRHRIRTRALA